MFRLKLKLNKEEVVALMTSLSISNVHNTDTRILEVNQKVMGALLSSEFANDLQEIENMANDLNEAIDDHIKESK